MNASQTFLMRNHGVFLGGGYVGRLAVLWYICEVLMTLIYYE